MIKAPKQIGMPVDLFLNSMFYKREYHVKENIFENENWFLNIVNFVNVSQKINYHFANHMHTITFLFSENRMMLGNLDITYEDFKKIFQLEIRNFNLNKLV